MRLKTFFPCDSGASIEAHSQHGPGVRLMGGDVSLDGGHFLQKPLEAITICLWIRLRRTEGIHSMFNTIGGHSLHHKGQYHFEIFDGRIRWFHRDEFAQQVFSVRTAWPLIGSSTWYHVVGTYDSRTHSARVFVNGDQVAENYGAGVLSQDWGSRAGFGSHQSQRRFIGSMDEIYIFSRAFTRKEIKKYFKNIEMKDPEDFYSPTEFSSTSASKGAKFTTYSMPSDEALPTSRPTREPSQRTKTTSTTPTTKPKPAITTPTTPATTATTRATTKQTTTTTTTTTKTTTKTTTTKTTTTTTITRTTPATHSTTGKKNEICELGNVYRNSDLIGGLGAGNFTDKGKVKSIEECMKICCESSKCTVAYMVELSCFAVACHNKKLCKTFKKSPLESSAVLGFVQRYPSKDTTPTGAATTQAVLFVRPTGASTVWISEFAGTSPSKAPKHRGHPSRHQDPAHLSRHHPGICRYSMIHHHVTLKGGLRAGSITRLAELSTMKECARRCCAVVSCDAALLMKETCFALHCSSKDLCQTRPSRLKNFSLMIQYIRRGQTKRKSFGTLFPFLTSLSLLGWC